MKLLLRRPVALVLLSTFTFLTLLRLFVLLFTLVGYSLDFNIDLFRFLVEEGSVLMDLTSSDGFICKFLGNFD